MLNKNRTFGIDSDENRDLNNYYWFKGALTATECEKIIEISKGFPKEAAGTFSEHGSEVRNSDIRWIPLNEDTEFIYDKIRGCCEEANKEQFKVDLTGFTEDLQFTEYEGEGKHYDWHPDTGPNKHKRKLSVVIQLSDPNSYKGGDLMLNPGQKTTVERGIGNIVVFPSFLLHKVSKMESGNRYTMVSWISGPPWK